MSATGISGIKSMTLREDFGQPTVVVEIRCSAHSLELGSIVSSIAMGYTDENAVMMTNGIVKEITQRRPERDYVITVHDALVRAVDYFIASSDPDAPMTSSNESAEALVGRLLTLATIAGYTTEATGFTFGVVDPVEINLISAWEEIDNINQICGFGTYCDSSGVVKFVRRSPFPETTESAEHVFTTGDSGDILTIEYAKSDEKLRNRVVVYGGQGIHAEAASPSDYLPSGFQKSMVIAHELIDTQGMADETAALNLTIFNRLTQTVTLKAKGKPTIRVRDIVGFTENFIGVSNQKMFVHAAEHTIDRDSGYTMNLTLTSPAGIISSGGGGSSGSEGVLGDRNNMFGLAILGTGIGIVIGTSDFESISPTWRDSSGSGATRITGHPLVFRLDPWDCAYKALCFTTTGLWATSNIRATYPTWTCVLTLAQMQAATEATATFEGGGYGELSFMMSPNVNGYAAMCLVGPTRTWFGRTNNYSGGAAGWTWTNVSAKPYRGSHMLISSHTTSKVYIAQIDVWKGGIKLRYSSDGGATFTTYTIPSHVLEDDGFPILFIPFNSNDQTIYLGDVRNPSNNSSSVWCSTTGPSGVFNDITPTVGAVRYGPNYMEAMTESPFSDGYHLYLMGSEKSFNGANGASALFMWKGASWVTLQTSVTTTWVGHAFGGWPYNNLQLQAHDAGFGSGHIGSTVDAGVTWTEKTGNLLTLQASTVKVSYLVPIWVAI